MGVFSVPKSLIFVPSIAWVVATLITLAAIPADARATIDSVPGNLPKTIAPSSYDIDVVPDLAAMKINGHEKIAIDVLAPTDSVVLNALDTAISSARLDGTSQASIEAGEQTMTMRFARTIPVGKHRLEISYVAKIGTSAQGLFVEKYTDQTTGKPTQMLATQFEATDARRMFPSWDEPIYRARFHLTATLPKAWRAVSNMPVESSVDVDAASRRVTFATTPSMPTYLLVLCAGELDALAGAAGPIKVGVYGTRGTGPELGYALTSLERLVPYFETYYGVRYPIPKIDLVTVPQFFGGAMENWGGMTFTESTVVYDPKLQPPSQQRDIFDIIAHETSHQWSGDLVTMGWWDSLWLNEGFATWMESKSTADLNPSWNWWLRFDTATNDSLVADSGEHTQRVSVPVHNETEANTNFDPDITYQKAGAFLRMLEAFLGPETFRRGLHEYFVANAYQSSVPSDLWTALSNASHRDVAAIAKSWIDQPGFPVVEVTSTCVAGKRSLELAQRRYATFEDRSATVWAIPLRIEPGDGSTTPYLFDTAKATISAGRCDAPLVVNGDDLGYYRVAYDAGSRALLRAHFTSLGVSNRISLLNDSWRFAVDGKSKLADYLAYVRSDIGDVEPHVADLVLGRFASMAAYEEGKSAQKAFEAKEIATLTPLFAALGGWDGPTTDVEVTDLRARVIEELGRAGDRGIVAEARKRFAQSADGSNSLSPTLKDVVLQIVGRNADEKTYDDLLRTARAAKDPIEAQQYFTAIFGAKDEALAKKSLAMSLDLPPQYASFAPQIVATVGQDHPELAWKFLKDHDDKLFASLSEFERIPYVTGVAGSFWRGVTPDDIEAYIKAKLPPAAAEPAAKAIEGVRANIAKRTRIVPQIDAWVATN